MILTANTVAKLLDHSTLQPFLTQEDIRKGCELALKYNTATVCARPQDMPLVSSMLKGSGILPCGFRPEYLTEFRRHLEESFNCF